MRKDDVLIFSVLFTICRSWYSTGMSTYVTPFNVETFLMRPTLMYNKTDESDNAV